MSAGKVVNLNRIRKQRKRAADVAQADENRIRHGRSGAEKARARQEAETRSRHLDGKSMGTGNGPSGNDGSEQPDRP
jgi:hypothetical protein